MLNNYLLQLLDSKLFDGTTIDQWPRMPLFLGASKSPKIR
jgi:hypothetical protein